MTMADTIAVMNAGVIEQLGSPAEIYEVPKTAFVANFLGQSNLVHGQITGREGDLLVVRIPGGEVRVPVARAADTTGGLIVGVRPEKLRIEYEPAENVNRVRGQVIDVSFTGVSTQYLVETPWDPERPVTCFEQNDDGRPEVFVGDNVSLVWEYAFTFGLDGDDDLEAGTEYLGEEVITGVEDDAEDE